MLIVHPYYEREFELMMRWLAWADELGGAKKHEVLFVIGKEVPNEMHTAVHNLALRVYSKINTIRAFYTDRRAWPCNANLTFQRTCWHISQNVGTPFMWCEPDCQPLVPGWWDQWEDEYKACGKPFMGCVVESPHHLTGNAIYPAHVENYSANVLLTEAVAWDVIDTGKILPNTHHSQRYHHQWLYGVPPQDPGRYSDAATHFATVKDLDIIKPGAILFHRNKDGSLIERLRERKNSPVTIAVPVREPEERSFHLPTVPKPAVPAPQPSPEPEAKPIPYKCGVLIRTFGGDAAWLPYSLQSVKTFLTLFHRVLVVAPKNDTTAILPICRDLGIEFMPIEPDPCHGYLAQQITKMKADEYLPECDYILHHDSDTLFKMPSTPRNFIQAAFGHRPIILMQDYATFPNGHMPWQKPTEHALGKAVKYEFMRRHPLLYPRWLYAPAREHLTQRFGMRWDQWIAGIDQRTMGFSEFNYLGAFAFENHYYKFRWIDVKKHDPGPDRVHQFASRQGITAEAKQKIDEILAGKCVGSQHDYRSETQQEGHIV